MIEVSVFPLLKLPFVYLILTCLRLALAYDSCSWRVLEGREATCFARYNLSDAFLNGLPVPTELTLYTINMVNLCRNLGNITSCLETATSQCKSPYFDYVSYRNTFEKICFNQRTFQEAEIYCDIDVLSTCLGEYRVGVEDLKYHTFLNRSGPPLADICTVLNKTRECIHIDMSDDCVQEMSEFLTDLYRGRFMSSVCSADPDADVNGNRRNAFSVLNYISNLLLFYILKTVCVIFNDMSYN